MTQLALSTMFAQQPRFADGADFARFAADAGYDAIEISHSTPPEKFQQIADCGILPITSVHAPAPWAIISGDQNNSALNLASIDEEERVEAMEATIETIRWASRVGARHVVVHLGAIVSGPLREAEQALRLAVGTGDKDQSSKEDLVEAARQARAEAAAPYLDPAKRSLHELVAAARPHGIAIGLENRLFYYEVPIVDEMAILLEDLPPSDVGYWHDVGHAEVLARLGLIDRSAWFDKLGGRLVGAHLHDVDGIIDHRAPGNGDVDWAYLVAPFGHLERITLEIDQGQDDALVVGVRDLLANAGVISAGP